MQIRKIYHNVKPELIYEEIKDFGIKYGAVIQDASLANSAMPGDSSSFMSRGVIGFAIDDGKGNQKECMTVHLLGVDKGETKVIFEVNEKLFPQEKLDAMESDLDFMFSSYEVKPD